MSTPPPAPLTPLAWCRRVLAALGHRQAHGRSTSELEMLLSYFVERDPSPEAFAHLLGQYVTSSRPGVAEAAVLDRAWQRSAGATAVTPPPSREETLRTLGARLALVGDDALLTGAGSRASAIEPGHSERGNDGR
jgi:hypothetical protein